MNDHLIIGQLESAAISDTAWERFVRTCERLCSGHLHRDHQGKPSFDGDQKQDGYSLDWLHDQFEAGLSPIAVALKLESKRKA